MVVQFKSKPKVSVCVVTYNQEKYISQCLRSIVNQKTDFDFEVIVSDDGSTDRTREIIEEFAATNISIRPVFRHKDVGCESSSPKGDVTSCCKNFVETHNLAAGKYVCHCDGDDRWLPGKLQAQANFLDQNPKVTVVWSRSSLFDESGTLCSGKECDYSMFKDGIVTFSQALRLGNIAMHSSIMYRSSARETRRPDFETLDIFYTWEFLSRGNGKVLDQVLCEYRVNVTNSLSSKHKVNNRRLFAQYAAHFLAKFPSERNNVFLFAFGNFLIDVKNMRSSAIPFFFLALKSISFVSFSQLLIHIKQVVKLKNPRVQPIHNSKGVPDQD